MDYDYMLDSVNGDKESVALLLGVFVEDHKAMLRKSVILLHNKTLKQCAQHTV
ncbi:hypothetical protein JCM19233_6128 [Vibrio astriarenae]|nr:hypothetical protein JCM19233_6128 [Vibrio sp. C7]